MNIPLIYGIDLVNGYYTNFFAGTFLLQITSYADDIANSISFLASAFFVVSLSIKVIGSFLNLSQAIYAQMFIRPILTICSLPLYGTLVQILMIEPTTFIADILTNSVAVSNDNVNLPTSCRPDWSDAFNGSGNFFDSVGFGNIMALLFGQGFLEIIHIFFCALATLIVFYYMFRMMITQAIFHVMGPIAITMSLYPGNENTTGKWFYGYLSVLLWYPLIILFLGVLQESRDQLPNIWIFIGDNGTVVLRFFYMIIVDVMLLYAMFQIPRMADYLVGGMAAAQGSTGGFLKTYLKSKLGIRSK